MQRSIPDGRSYHERYSHWAVPCSKGNTSFDHGHQLSPRQFHCQQSWRRGEYGLLMVEQPYSTGWLTKLYTLSLTLYLTQKKMHISTSMIKSFAMTNCSMRPFCFASLQKWAFDILLTKKAFVVHARVRFVTCISYSNHKPSWNPRYGKICCGIHGFARSNLP